MVDLEQPKSAPKPPPRVEPTTAPEPTLDETRKITVDVGVMEATVTPGEDGEFGTEDDVKDVKPKKRRGRPRKKG